MTTACLMAKEVKKFQNEEKVTFPLVFFLGEGSGVANSLTVGQNDISKKKRLP